MKNEKNWEKEDTKNAMNTLDERIKRRGKIKIINQKNQIIFFSKKDILLNFLVWLNHRGKANLGETRGNKKCNLKRRRRHKNNEAMRRIIKQ